MKEQMTNVMLLILHYDWYRLEPDNMRSLYNGIYHDYSGEVVVQKQQRMMYTMLMTTPPQEQLVTCLKKRFFTFRVLTQLNM